MNVRWTRNYDFKVYLQKRRSAPTRRAGMRLMVRMELAKYTLAVSSTFSATPGVFHRSIREVAVGRKREH